VSGRARALCAALAVAAACGGTSEPAAPAAGGDPVSAAAPAGRPRAGDDHVGVLAARRSATVAAEVGGRIAEVLVHIGDRVEVGAPIARIDDLPARQRLAAARAAAEQARAARHGAALEVDDARARLALARRMLDRGITSRESVRAAGVAVGVAEAARERAAAAERAALAEVAEVERQLAATTVTAPLAGVVSQVRARVGDVVDRGAALAAVIDPSELRVRFAVPPDRADEVPPGTRVVLRPSGVGGEIPAIVRHVAPALEPPLRLVVVEAEVAAPGGAGALPVQPGAVGRVTVAAGE